MLRYRFFSGLLLAADKFNHAHCCTEIKDFRHVSESIVAHVNRDKLFLLFPLLDRLASR
jgi:hypothetical protein